MNELTNEQTLTLLLLAIDGVLFSFLLFILIKDKIDEYKEHNAWLNSPTLEENFTPRELCRIFDSEVTKEPFFSKAPEDYDLWRDI